MRAIAHLFGWLTGRLEQLGVCANGGLLVGMLTGSALALIDFIHGPLQPTDAELLRVWAITALFGWLVLLFVFVALARWSLRSVALPTLVNSVLVSGLTILICRALNIYGWGFWIGIAAGLAVGLILCGLYRVAEKD